MGKLVLKSRHRVMCGRSDSEDDVAKLIGSDSVECGFTSPPYNVGTNSIGGNKQMVESKYQGVSDDLSDDEYFQLLVKSTKLALKYCRSVGVNLQMLAKNKRVVLKWAGELADHFVDRLIWFKGQGCPAINANVMNHRFEDVWIFSKEENKATRLQATQLDFEDVWIFSKKKLPSRVIPTGNFRHTVSNVYQGSGGSNGGGESLADLSKIHAARMPMHFATHCIRILGGSKDSVFDGFGGTGTSLIAAEQLGMKAYLMELSPKYVDVIIQRFENLTGKKAVLSSGN